MSNLSYIITPKSISLVLDGKSYSVPVTNAQFDSVKKAIKNGDKKSLRTALDASTTINKFGNGKITVKGGHVYYGPTLLSGVVVDRILSMIAEGFDASPMIKFLENLYNNPSATAIAELYLWLEASDLPITEDGFFLAYKKVRSDYLDIHSGTMSNAPGLTVEMPRNQVDDNRNNTCSRGLHFCSESYLGNFGSHSTDSDRVVLVKVNPADVVSIPSDYSNAKGRTAKYLVMEDVTDKVGALAKSSVYNYQTADQWDAPTDNCDENVSNDYHAGFEDGWDVGYDEGFKDGIESNV